MIKFSVVCPVHNSEAFILDTIGNIVNQSVQPDELILVDDGSTDRTRFLLEQFVSSYTGTVTIKLIFSVHKGPGAARNIGIQNCRNRWIAFMDSDDSWEQQKLQRVASFIDTNPKCNIFCHGERFMMLNQSAKELNYALSYSPDIPLITQLYKRNLFSPSATVCCISLFHEKGGFDEELSSSQDYELWLKHAPIMCPFFITEILGFYYEREGNISSKKRIKRLKNLLKVQHRYMNKVSFLSYFFSVTKTLLYFIVSLIKK
jgi:glycosyltransferase involved in cell wall biosynthesis